MTTKMVLGLSVVIIFLGGSAYSSSDKVGSSGAAFLKIGVGARASAMGEAYTGISDDIASLHWNPAGLVQVRSPEVTLMHMAWFGDTNYEYIGAAMPAENVAFGASAVYIDAGKFEGRDGAGGLINDFKAKFIAGSIGAALIPRENLAVGAALKLIQQKIGTENSDSQTISLGVLYRLGNLSSGLAIQNAGGHSEFYEQADPLPMIWQLGVSYKFLTYTVSPLLSLDILFPRDNAPEVSFGCEADPHPVLRLRAGYKKRFGRSDKHGGLGGFSLGMGFIFSGTKNYQGPRSMPMRLDYAFVPYGDLGQTHRFSVTMNFE